MYKIFLTITLCLFLVNGAFATHGKADDIETDIATAQTDLDAITDEWKDLVVIVDYPVAKWQDAAFNKVMDFPANVDIEFYLSIYDSTELVCTGATDSTLILFGTQRIVDVMTGTAGAAAHFDPGEHIVFPATAIYAAGSRSVQPDAVGLTVAVSDGIVSSGMFHGICKNNDIGYELQGTGTSGIAVWVLRYKANRGVGDVVEGDGGTL